VKIVTKLKSIYILDWEAGELTVYKTIKKSITFSSLKCRSLYDRRILNPMFQLFSVLLPQSYLNPLGTNNVPVTMKTERNWKE